MSCGNTHSPDTAKAAAESARAPSHPQLPAPKEPVLALPAPRRNAHLLHGTARHNTLEYEHRGALMAQGLQVFTELALVKADGTRGRADLVAFLDRDQKEAAVVDFKTDRFDRLSLRALEARVDKYIEQLRGYCESPSLELAVAMPALHIDERPTRDGYAEYIEDRCLAEGIMVTYLDE